MCKCEDSGGVSNVQERVYLLLLLLSPAGNGLSGGSVVDPEPCPRSTYPYVFVDHTHVEDILFTLGRKFHILCVCVVCGVWCVCVCVGMCVCVCVCVWVYVCVEETTESMVDTSDRVEVRNGILGS